MKNIVFILALLSMVFLAGCAKSGITGRAVQDVNPTATEESTTSIFFQYQENQKECEGGVIRKQILANGTVKEYCNRVLLERKKCDLDGRCGNYEECINGYCRTA